MESFELSDEVAEKVLKKHKALGISLVKNFARNQEEFIDLEQEADIALMKAAKTYDNRKNAKFSTYARKVINNRLKTAINKINKINKNEKNDYSIFDNGESLCCEELNYNKRRNIHNAYDLLEVMDKHLTKEEIEIVNLIYEGKTLKEIGEKFNCTAEWIRQKGLKIRKKLKPHI